MCLETFTSVINIVESIAVIVGTFFVVRGGLAWRDQVTEQKKMELTEQILCAYWEVAASISFMRWNGRFAQSTHHDVHDTQNMRATKSTSLQQVQMLRERYNLNIDRFSRLKALKPRARYYFDKECSDLIDKVDFLLNKIFAAAGHLEDEFSDEALSSMTNEPDRLAELLSKKEGFKVLIEKQEDGEDPVERELKEIHKDLERLLMLK